MALGPDQLRCIPLLRGFSDEELRRLADLFQPLALVEGQTLFEPGAPGNEFYVLTAGEVTVYEGDQVRCQLWPPCPIGELGAIAGLSRVARGVASRPSELWRVAREPLLGFFDRHAAIAIPFYQNLVSLIADKVRRDQIRLEDMRRNIIRTQKAMKQMRDYLLESQDTPISDTLHNKLEELIRHNRRINYRVEPPDGHPAQVRLDGGGVAAVTQISRTHLSFVMPEAQALPAIGAHAICVLGLDELEIPISGTVLRTINRRVDLELDLLVDEYGAALDGYLTRVQMLDFMV
jgi:CRP-like cAMP-binding protein